MIIPTDSTLLLRDLNAYAFDAATPAELADKLQHMVGSAVDRIFTGTELLYAFREQLSSQGMTLLGQLTGFAINSNWIVPGQPNRLSDINKGVLRDVEGAVYTDLTDPDPVMNYRSDGQDWRSLTAPTLDQLKAAKWLAVKNLRDEKENSTCNTPSGVVQIDPKSKQNINGLVTMAMVANSQQQAFSVVFTLNDNSEVTLDATGMINLGVAVGQYVDALYANARALRAQIDAAADQTALDAIDVTAGWPA